MSFKLLIGAVFAFALAGCVNDKAITACGVACKDQGGVKFVDAMSCTCRGLP